MKSVSIAVFATTLLSMAPSYAQYPGGGIRDREERIEHLIERSRDERRISPDQADRAFDRLRHIRDEEADMRDRHDGHLSYDDRRELQDRLADLDHEVDRMREANADEPRQFDPGRAIDRMLGQHDNQ